MGIGLRTFHHKMKVHVSKFMTELRDDEGVNDLYRIVK
jgi:hypothetical protein